jgi:hypothetical protein
MTSCIVYLQSLRPCTLVWIPNCRFVRVGLGITVAHRALLKIWVLGAARPLAFQASTGFSGFYRPHIMLHTMTGFLSSELQDKLNTARTDLEKNEQLVRGMED